jgi:glycerol-3-phosphate dehydrogenase
MKIAVLGAGHGGVAAADMTLAGHEVRLFQIPSFIETFQKIKEAREINIVGVGPLSGRQCERWMLKEWQ